ncbi:zinc finger MYM-type protein 1-like [Rhopalosiphum padi]|uniref:zinc finger MYM-type protein 1-like n=1 Tax=Rhopalosiphum padi TaxID=40932 RepID=UPI00298D8833|nr:zinc finger MYM-type protein 1-like [Rhopalosiphum padi]
MRIDSNYTPDFSKSERDGRTLTKDWFYKVLKNGSKVKRSFLAYSETKNSLYCISCRMFSHMFSHESKMSSLAKEEGLANWKKLSDKIPEHENSSNHKHYFCTWKSLETSLGMGGIDKELQDAIQKEETHWKEVLHCIVVAILYLAKQGSPFRGTNERCDFENPSSGKFLNTIALLSHYNVPLQKHIERHKKGQISYFSSDIQDEFLDIIADKIRQDIIQNVKKAKYFALMFDCTPDISNNEQMTEIIRYVNGTEVVESFLDFFLVSDKTGEGLSQEIIKKVKNDGLDLELCRAQSYDNGSNMAGKYKGVQARILKENKYAYFLPCSAHSLNLVGVHAADACLSASNYFGVLHSLYNYFSRSTSRWEVLQKHVPLTLKAESKTRWSARLESVEVIFKHIHKIFLALDELCTNGSTPETKTEAKILMGQMKDFQFSVLTSFWYSVLKPIDRANKFLQGKDVTVDRAMRNIQGLINLLSSKRENLVSEAMADAKIMAQNNGLETDFKEKRR